MREYVAPCCAHTPYDYFDFNLKSQGRKLAEKLYFFVKFMYVTFCDLQGHHRFFAKFMYVTFCDLQGHRRTQVMEPNERLYMSSYL